MESNILFMFPTHIYRTIFYFQAIHSQKRSILIFFFFTLQFKHYQIDGAMTGYALCGRRYGVLLSYNLRWQVLTTIHGTNERNLANYDRNIGVINTKVDLDVV